MPAISKPLGERWYTRYAYASAASVSNTISCPVSAVGVFLLAMFHSSVPSHDAPKPTTVISSQNVIGSGPDSDCAKRASPVPRSHASESASPSAAIGSVVMPCAVAHVVEVCSRWACSQRALWIGYHVHAALATMASAAPPR